VGQWLPEPIITDGHDDPAGHAEMADSLSLAMLVLLESLSPEQRAVLLLHDVFGYGHAQIAQIIGKSQDNVRQLAIRARRHVKQRRPRFQTTREQQQELARRLLGGRAGDLLGRRRVFIAGLVLFSAASLAGGLATSQAWLLAARAVQGAGAAMIAPAALALITTTFPEGQPRNRAMGVYAAMSVAGGAVGLITGGLLTTYASWRWVLFVNVPIGLAAALAAARVLPESPRQRGRFDLPGAITGTGGTAALVFGLSNAATSPDGVSHWGDAKVVASLAASAVLLAAFAVIEIRSKRPCCRCACWPTATGPARTWSCCASAPPSSACSSS
jgi:hypothetical protein